MIYDGANSFNTWLGDFRYNTTVVFAVGLVDGDIVRMEWTASHHIKVVINNSTEFSTYPQDVSNKHLQPAIKTYTTVPVEYVVPALRINGNNITGYEEGTADIQIIADIITPVEGVEFYAEAALETTYSGGSDVTTIHDESGYGRDLTAGKTKPIFVVGAINSLPTYHWNSSSAMSNSSTIFRLKCGWVIAKYTDSTFPNPTPSLGGNKGLLTDVTGSLAILVGQFNTTSFQIFSELVEYRLQDRIYTGFPHPAPMASFGLIFFRFWEPVTITSLQIGQWFNFGDTRWIGDVALVALYSQDFSEQEIRSNSQLIATKYALTLADVYPYQADASGHSETTTQLVNAYYPPEGDKVVEAIGDAKQTLQLTFSVADQSEVDTMRTFHAAHYPTALPFMYRDYRFTPPRDVEGYFDSMYNLDGAMHDFQYSWKFRQR